MTVVYDTLNKTTASFVKPVNVISVWARLSMVYKLLLTLYYGHYPLDNSFDDDELHSFNSSCSESARVMIYEYRIQSQLSPNCT